MAGQRDEDVVERRPANRDVVDADARAVEAADRFGDAAAALAERQCEHSALALRAVVGERDERFDGLVGGGAVRERHLEPLTADAVLELVGGALGDHLAVVDHGDPVGEAVRLVEVLGGEQHRRPGRDARLDRLPQREPAARVEPGGRFVEEDHRRARHQRGREVETAAHAARVGLGEPAAGVGELEALEQLVGALAGLGTAHVVEPADHLEVLATGQVLVDGRVLAGQPDPRAQLGGVA